MKRTILELRTALVMTLWLSLVLCGVYPGAVWVVSQVVFPVQANGSLLFDASGVVRGSALLGQNFRGEGYFHPRPSTAGADGYDGRSSGGSNLGPTSEALKGQVRERIANYRKLHGLEPEEPVPADAVTASASGLDPHIGIRNAEIQARRVARVRGIDEEVLREWIAANTEGGGVLGFLGERGVNVLRLNLALDGMVRTGGEPVRGSDL